MTQFWCLNKFSKQIKSTQSQFISGNHCEPGTSGNIRILRYFTRILRTWKFISHVLILFAVPKRYKPLFTLLSSPPRALSLFPSPKHQIHHPKSISRPRKLQIGVEDHPFQSFLPGVASVLTGWLQFQLEKVPKLGQNGLIILGCFKRFLLGQSSSYESLY